MKIATTPGETYAITATVPCTVSAVMPKSSPLLLITIEEPGQYLVVAPTTALYITDDDALVTRSFRSAPASLSLRSSAGGGTIGEEITEQVLGEGGAEDNLNSAGFAFTCEQSGTLKTVSIQGRTSMEFHHNPLWIKVWKKTEEGHVLLGRSGNSVVQENNSLNEWTMENGVRLAAGDILYITTHGEDTRDDPSFAAGGTDARLLARVTSISHQEGTGCLNDAGTPAWDYLPVCTITCSQPANLALYARVLPVSPEVFENLSPKRPQTLYFVVETAPVASSSPSSSHP